MKLVPDRRETGKDIQSRSELPPHREPEKLGYDVEIRRFDVRKVKAELDVFDRGWRDFVAAASKMTERSLDDRQARQFFRDVLSQEDGKPPTPKAEKEHNTLVSLLRSAPGQQLRSAKGTLWGALNAITYYVDHVRGAGMADKLGSAWFGAGATLKERALAKAVEMIA